MPLLTTGAGLFPAIASATTTWNPSDKNGLVSLSGGNLVATEGTGTGGSVRAIASATGSDKKHFEVTVTAGHYPVIGLGKAGADLNSYPGSDGNSIGYLFNGTVQVGGPGVATLTAYTQGDTISIEVDRGGNIVRFALNGGSWSSDIDISGVAGNLYPMTYVGFVESTTHTANFGGSAYAKAASSGFGNF